MSVSTGTCVAQATENPPPLGRGVSNRRAIEQPNRRICTYPGCNTILDKYNSGQYCYFHNDMMQSSGSRISGSRISESVSRLAKQLEECSERHNGGCDRCWARYQCRALWDKKAADWPNLSEKRSAALSKMFDEIQRRKYPTIALMMAESDRRLPYGSGYDEMIEVE